MFFNFNVADRKVRAFAMQPSFLEQFKGKQPDWGYGGLGYFTFKRTYARALPEGGTEEWWQTCQRVVEGVYNIQKIHCRHLGLPWSEPKAQKSAQDMYQRMWDFKFLPPGRGLWVMGTDLVYEKGSAALQNCSFFSTDDINTDFAAPFCFLMDMSMLGVGVGGDTRGAGKVRLQIPKLTAEPFVVEDSREGWVELARTVLNSFVGKGAYPTTIDYRQLRPRGAPLKTFGGVSSGPDPLKKLVQSLTQLLLPKGIKAEVQEEPENVVGTYLSGEPEQEIHRISSSQIVDVFNFIGKCVVAGGIRRSSEILFGEPDDQDFIHLKQDNEALMDRRWVSNNSLFATVGMDYAPFVDSIMTNGEPGLFWLENARKFGRMGDLPNNKDSRVMGTNPCVTGDTLIAVADGRGAVSIQQLAQEGQDVPVYALDSKGHTVIRMGRNPRLTGVGRTVLRVILDNGTSLRVTPEHKMILRDGSSKEAKDLICGEALPKFYRETATLSKTNPKLYVKVLVSALEPEARQFEMEHRFIARFHAPATWAQLHENGKKNGWSQGGLVVHHKDFNPLNNRVQNLEVMSFREHRELHTKLADLAGEKNPMYGRHHQESTRKKIGAKAKARWANPDYAQHMKEVIYTPENLQKMSKSGKETRDREWQKYYKEQEQTTSLPTERMGGRLYAKRECESCAKEFLVPWRQREKSFCSRTCQTAYLAALPKRKVQQQVAFNTRQQDTLRKQLTAYNDLKQELKRPPLKKEWEDRCRTEGISFRFRTKGTTTNPHVLNGFKELQKAAGNYNSRIVSIIAEPDVHDVYNITVDGEHNYAVCTKFNHETFASLGVFIANCGEIALENAEFCNLVECFPATHNSFDDFKRTLKMAYLYAKTVTLIPSHDPRANAVMMRNRRIGCSLSGIQQAKQKLGYREFVRWCDNGYNYIQELDQIYSDWLCIPRSIKSTTVKPSGTVSILTGATPGIHHAHSEYYIRNVRVQKTSPLLEACVRAGYLVEPDSYSDDTSVVSFPVHEANFYKGKKDVTIWEQFADAAVLQKYWVDNQVSITISVKAEEKKDIVACLETFEDQLKSISLLPSEEHGYVQAPYIEITKEKYEALMSRITPLDLSADTHEVTEKFCSNDSCELPKPKS